MRDLFTGKELSESLAALIAVITVVGALLANFAFGSSSQAVAFMLITGGLIILLFPVMKIISKESFGLSEYCILICALALLFAGARYLLDQDPAQTIEIQPVVPDDVV